MLLPIQILLRISQSNGKKENPRNPDLDFLIEIHPEAFDCKIRNPDFPTERNPGF